MELLRENKDVVNACHPDTGDTPLIAGARNGQKEVSVLYFLQHIIRVVSLSISSNSYKFEV